MTRLAKLGEVAICVAGVGFPKDMQGYPEGEVPVFKVGDISDALKSGTRYLRSSPNNLTLQAARRLSSNLVPVGTTVFAKIGEGLKLNRRAMLSRPSLIDNNVMGLVPKPSVINPDYLYYFMQTVDLGELSRATAIPSVRKSDVIEVPIPLPTLGRQGAIVAEIEKQFSRLDEAVANLKRVKANLKRYKAAVLKAAVEGRLVPTEAELALREGGSYEDADQMLHRITKECREAWSRHSKWKASAKSNSDQLPHLPEGWKWATFDMVADRVTVGHVGSMKNEYMDEGIPFLRSQNVRPNRFDPVGLKYISLAFHDSLQKSRLVPGDIVVIRSGSVGVSCVIPDSMGEANCSDLVIIKSPRAVLPTYGAYYLNAVVDSRIAAGRVGVALVHFNTQSVANLPVPVPPIAEQHRIVAEVDRRLSIAREVEAEIDVNLKRAQALRHAVLASMFSQAAICETMADT